MIKEVSKQAGTGAVTVGGYGFLGMIIEGIVAHKWPWAAGERGTVTMATTAFFHSIQKGFWAWMASKGVKAPENGDPPASP